MVVAIKVHSHCQINGLSAQCGSTQWEVIHNPWLLVIANMVSKMTVCGAATAGFHFPSQGKAQPQDGLYPVLIN